MSNDRSGTTRDPVPPGGRVHWVLLAWSSHLPPSAVSHVGDVRFRRVCTALSAVDLKAEGRRFDPAPDHTPSLICGNATWRNRMNRSLAVHAVMNTAVRDGAVM